MAIISAYRYEYTGDGVTQQFPVVFDYVYQREVEVEVDGVPTAHIVQSGNVILGVVPVLGAIVVVQRNTDARNPAHRFAHGSPLLPAYLDANFKQALHAVQEAVFTSDNAYSTATAANATAVAAEIKADAAIVTADNSIVDAAASVIASNAALDASGIAQAASAQAAIDSANALNIAGVANANASAAVVTADNAETVATSIATVADSALDKAQLALDTVDAVVSTGVSTFNGRTGFVEPVAGDYTVDMVPGAAASTDVAAALALKVDLADALTVDDVVQTEGTSTTDVMSQKAVTHNFINNERVKQVTGTSDSDIMSQKAVTDTLGQPYISGSITLNGTTNNTVAMADIVTVLSLEIGDVIRIDTGAYNKLHTVESSTDNSSIIVNYEHAGNRGDGSLKLPDFTGQATVTRIAKWFNASVGLGQAWINMLARRVVSTIYTNTTNRSIQVSIYANNASTSTSLFVDQAEACHSASATYGHTFQGQAIVPGGSTYQLTGDTFSARWRELR